MMPEISLNILDVAENSIRAQASLVEIEVDVQPAQDKLAVTIRDNGRGMTAEKRHMRKIRFSPQEPHGKWDWVSRFSGRRR